METPLDLASLPESIIKRIILMADVFLEDLRLISPTWNFIVVDYLDRPHLGTLERVYLYSGIPDHNKSSERNIGSNKNYEQVQMVAMMPERHATKVGVGRWLDEFQNYPGEALEVSCSPEQLKLVRPAIRNGDTSMFNALPVLALAALANAANMLSDVSDVWKYFIIFTAVAYAIHSCLSEKKKTIENQELLCGDIEDESTKSHIIDIQDPKHFPRLAQFFSKFSHIETLVLDDLRKFDKGEHNIVGAIQHTLGEIKIDRLDINERDVGRNYCKFAVALADLGVCLDLYDINYSSHLLTFSNARFYWDKMAAELAEQQVAMRMLSKHEAAFSTSGHTFPTRTHIRCEKTGDITNQPLTPVQAKRGFILSKY